MSSRAGFSLQGICFRFNHEEAHKGTETRNCSHRRKVKIRTSIVGCYGIQFCRCSAAACNSLGYQARGAEIVRPSFRRTLSESWSKDTSATRSSAAIAKIPTPPVPLGIILSQGSLPTQANRRSFDSGGEAPPPLRMTNQESSSPVVILLFPLMQIKYQERYWAHLLFTTIFRS